MLNHVLLPGANQLVMVVGKDGNLSGEYVTRATAHVKPGVRHLSVQVLLFNKKKELLLHKRHSRKLLANKWDSPTTHVLKGETPVKAARYALAHEYSIFKKVKLERIGEFYYKANHGNGMCDDEYCLVFLAVFDGKVVPDPKEINGKIKTFPTRKVLESAEKSSEKYAGWFLRALTVFLNSPQSKRFL